MPASLTEKTAKRARREPTESRTARRPSAAATRRTAGRPSKATGRRSKAVPRKPRDPALLEARGVLEMHPKGYGFLRDPSNDLRPTREDTYVADTMIQELKLQPGNYVHGWARPVSPEQGARLEEVDAIDGLAPADFQKHQMFDAKTPINPEDWLRLETGAQPLTTRVIDMLTPLGKGQRALIVAPPRSGKTIMLQQIGQAVAVNYPGVKLMALLIDERPEEVTDMRRQFPGEVIASSLDQDVENHTRVAQLVVERCKRLAELGHDVFLLVDSLTRISRAFNKRIGNSGRTMTGGVDVRALDTPKKLFASARAFEEGGSLTIVATVLVDTGSRMDELIFQEFKGTGNMEMVLDRNLADRRVWPAMDVSLSGTRREEKLLPPDQLAIITVLRRTLSSMSPVEAMEKLTEQLGRFPTNEEFLKLITKMRAA